MAGAGEVTDRVPLGELMSQHADADDTLRRHEARRQARRLGDLEQRFENVVSALDTHQDEIARLRGELAAIKREQSEVKETLVSLTESLGGLIDA